MRLLLDTHALVWALLEPRRIPPPTLERIRDPHNDVIVSAVAPWEISNKARLGKLDGVEPLIHGYAEHLAQLRAREIAITSRHTLTAGQLNWQHRDPFDRVLVAQAMIESLTLVTADSAIRSFPAVLTLW